MRDRAETRTYLVDIQDAYFLFKAYLNKIELQEESFLEEIFYHLVSDSFEVNADLHLHLARTLNQLMEAEDTLRLMGAIKTHLLRQVNWLEHSEGITVTECVPWNKNTLWIRKWF